MGTCRELACWPLRSLALPAAWRQLQQRLQRGLGLCELQQRARQYEHELWLPPPLPAYFAFRKDYESPAFYFDGRGSVPVGSSAIRTKTKILFCGGNNFPHGNAGQESPRSVREGERLLLSAAHGAAISLCHSLRRMETSHAVHAGRGEHFGRAAQSERPHLRF